MPADLNGWNKNKKDKGFEPPKFEPPKIPKGFSFGLIVLGIFLVFIIMLKPFVVIPAWEVGVVSTEGKISPKPLGPGVHFYVPLFQKIILLDTRIHTSVFQKNPETDTLYGEYSVIKIYPPIKVLDKNGIPVEVELRISYRLNPRKAAYIVENYGKEWEYELINPIVFEAVRNVIGKYSAKDLISNGNEISSQIGKLVREKFNSIPEKPVVFVKFQLMDVLIPKEIALWIQNVELAKLKAQKAKYDAAALKAQTQKQMEIIQAQAKIQKLKAQIQAEINSITAKSLTPALLKLKEIETQKDFINAISKKKDVKIIVVTKGLSPQAPEIKILENK